MTNIISDRICRSMISTFKLVALVFGLLQCVTYIHGQVLDQQIVSMTRFESCIESPLATNVVQDVSDLDPQDQLDNAPPRVDGCSGTVSTVIALGVRIQPGAVQGGQTFRFNVGDVLDTQDSDYDGEIEDGDIPICQGTEFGENCELLDNEISITISSTELFAVYDLIPRKEIPYTYRNRFAIIEDDDLGHILCNEDDPLNFDGTDPICSVFDQDKSGIPSIGKSLVVSKSCSSTDVLSEITETGSFSDYIFQSSEGQTREPVCPPEEPNSNPDDWRHYYTSPEQNPRIPESGVCDLAVFGPTLGDSTEDDDDNPSRGYLLESLNYGPSCSVFDTDPRAKAAMHLEVAVDTNGQTKKFRMGTEKYGTIQGIPGVMFAQINGVNTGSGLLGPYLPGQYVVCNSCPQGSSDCIPGFIDDLAGGPRTAVQEGEIKTLFNPYREYKLSSTQQERSLRCPLPSARCREKFKGTPSTAFTYFVPDFKQIENSNLCNANGLGDNPYENPDIRRHIANVLAQCPETNEKCEVNPDCISDPNSCPPDPLYIGRCEQEGVDDCNAFKACLPGHEQPIPAPSALFNKNFVATPCKVSQRYGESLSTMDPDRTDNNFEHVEPDRNIISPQYFHQGQRVYRDVYGGSTVSLSMTLYVVAEDIVSVTSLAPGRFASYGQTCGGTNGGAGVIGFRIQNTGNAVGTYIVDIGFFLPDNETAQLTVDTQDAQESEKLGSLSTADVVVRVPPLSVSAGGFKDGYVSYEYSGELGNSVIARLVLRAESASGRQALDSASVACQNIVGTTTTNALFNPDDPFNEAQAGIKCYWWKFWGGCLANWGVVEVMIFVLIGFLVFINLILIVIFSYWVTKATSQGRKALSVSKKTLKQKKELQSLTR